MAQKINRLGETKINKYGNKMTIVEYKDCHNITVEFDNGYIAQNRSYTEFKNISIKNPHDKSVFGIGYIGEGKYTMSENGKHTIQYEYWRGMLRRCYDEKYQLKQASYIGCSVCDEWLNFQVFSKWFDENYYTLYGENMCLDKDILNKNNKIYSPETCVFVPNRINTLFVKQQLKRGLYPIGVSTDKRCNKYQARCRVYIDGKTNRKHLGLFDTPKKAFYDGYKPFKESYIKEVADEYKDIIPKPLYEAMYRYVVEIDD